MLRTGLFGVVLVIVQMAAPMAYAQPSTKKTRPGTPKPTVLGTSKPLEIGKELTSELGNTKEDLPLNPRRNVSAFVAKFPVRFEAGKPISLHATVTGDERRVALQLLDPSSSLLKTSSFDTKSSSLHIDEASVTGVYTIVVASDLIGRFTLLATTDEDAAASRGGVTVESLEQRIQQLEKELAAMKADLAALKSKAK